MRLRIHNMHKAVDRQDSAAVRTPLRVRDEEAGRRGRSTRGSGKVLPLVHPSSHFHNPCFPRSHLLLPSTRLLVSRRVVAQHGHV